MQTTKRYFWSAIMILVGISWIFIAAPLMLRGSTELQTTFWVISGLLVIPAVLLALKHSLKKRLTNQKDDARD